MYIEHVAMYVNELEKTNQFTATLSSGEFKNI